MSSYKWCHGPYCHERETTTRVRGNKGSKVLKTMRVNGDWRQGTWHEYFCDQTCLMHYIKKHFRNIIAIAPCTEAKETPIEDPYKDPDTYGHYWTFEKKEVDNNSNMG